MSSRPNDHHDRTYRVELISHTSRVLGRVHGVFPHRRTLDPYVSRCRLDGATGDVVLIDEETDAVVARTQVVPWVQRGAR